jgi:sec-independent protein translocase protein TatA
MPFGVHPLWLFLLLIIVLIIFGPGKLPELGAGIGKAMREFRKATSDLTDEVKRAGTEEPSSSSTTASSNTEHSSEAADRPGSERPKPSSEPQKS